MLGCYPRRLTENAKEDETRAEPEPDATEAGD
jgi:hypothetical protein